MTDSGVRTNNLKANTIWEPARSLIYFHLNISEAR